MRFSAFGQDGEQRHPVTRENSFFFLLPGNRVLPKIRCAGTERRRVRGAVDGRGGRGGLGPELRLLRLPHGAHRGQQPAAAGRLARAPHGRNQGRARGDSSHEGTPCTSRDSAMICI